MAFDLDDEELKATREMPCNKIKYNYKNVDPKDIAEKARLDTFIGLNKPNQKEIYGELKC